MQCMIELDGSYSFEENESKLVEQQCGKTKPNSVYCHKVTILHVGAWVVIFQIANNS